MNITRLRSSHTGKSPLADVDAGQGAPTGFPTREQCSPLELGRALAADLGGRIAHAWVDGASHQVSTLDLLGPGLTLFAGPECGQCEVPATVPVTARRLDMITARALGIDASGALLVRPDGAPADSFAVPAEASELVRAAA